MKKLFTDDIRESYTEEGLTLDKEVYSALSSIIDNCAKAGYSMRDVFYVVNSVATEMTLMRLICPEKTETKENP